MFQLNFTPQIPVGQVVITPAAAQRLSLGEVTQALRRHARGDQGDFDEPSGSGRGGSALHDCQRLSAYRAADGTRFWIITDPEPTRTTVLLPEDF